MIANLPFNLQQFSLLDLQNWNEAIYGAKNRRDFGTLAFPCRMGNYASRILLWVRKQEMDRLGYHLCVMLSWLAAIANKEDVTLHDEVTKHCGLVASADTPIAVLQSLFISRHSTVKLKDASLCLAEKVLAVGAQLEYYEGTHQVEHLILAKRRMAQCFEALCVEAGLFEVKLQEGFLKYFGDGCNICHHTPCDCEHRTDKVK